MGVTFRTIPFEVKTKRGEVYHLSGVRSSRLPEKFVKAAQNLLGRVLLRAKGRFVV
jgi:hypothetical protein